MPLSLPRAADRARGVVFGAVLAIAIAATMPALGQTETSGSDPFAPLSAMRGEAAPVPPRALAVIPERHTGRLVRVVDALVAIDPQFGDIARGAGLSGRVAIQFRTREAHVPMFVPKTDTMISTMLQIPIGATIEVEGLLIDRDGSFFFLASQVRASARGRTAPSSPRR